MSVCATSHVCTPVDSYRPPHIDTHACFARFKPWHQLLLTMYEDGCRPTHLQHCTAGWYRATSMLYYYSFLGFTRKDLDGDPTETQEGMMKINSGDQGRLSRPGYCATGQMFIHRAKSHLPPDLNSPSLCQHKRIHKQIIIGTLQLFISNSLLPIKYFQRPSVLYIYIYIYIDGHERTMNTSQVELCDKS